MEYVKPNQKLIAFMENSPDIEAVKADMKAGWSIVSLVKNGNYYVGIMEEVNGNSSEGLDTLLIPLRKKIKASVKDNQT